MHSFFRDEFFQDRMTFLNKLYLWHKQQSTNKIRESLSGISLTSDTPQVCWVNQQDSIVCPIFTFSFLDKSRDLINSILSFCKTEVQKAAQYTYV